MEKFLKNIQWLVFVYAAYNLYSINDEYDPKPDQVRAQNDKLRQKLNKSQKVKKEIDEFYKNIKEAELKIQKVRESVEKTQQLLPGEISDVENVALLRKVSEDLNIKTMNIVPTSEVINGIFITKQYRYNATATYIQFLIFFERISNSKRVLNIKELKLKKAQTTRRGTIQLLNGSFSLEAYKFNPNYKETEGDKKDELPTLPSQPPHTTFLRGVNKGNNG